MTIQQLYIFHPSSRLFLEDFILGISSSLYHLSSRLFHEDSILNIQVSSSIRHHMSATCPLAFLYHLLFVSFIVCMFLPSVPVLISG